MLSSTIWQQFITRPSCLTETMVVNNRSKFNFKKHVSFHKSVKIKLKVSVKWKITPFHQNINTVNNIINLTIQPKKHNHVSIFEPWRFSSASSDLSPLPNAANKCPNRHCWPLKNWPNRDRSVWLAAWKSVRWCSVGFCRSSGVWVTIAEMYDDCDDECWAKPLPTVAVHSVDPVGNAWRKDLVHAVAWVVLRCDVTEVSCEMAIRCAWLVAVAAMAVLCELRNDEYGMNACCECFWITINQQKS